jgi:hypothetical protein
MFFEFSSIAGDGTHWDKYIPKNGILATLPLKE